jgi:hypothetical protein
MNTFEAITLIVTFVGIALALGPFRPSASLALLGRDRLSFAHSDDLPLSEQPSEDERDAPLPRRELRGRPR